MLYKNINPTIVNQVKKTLKKGSPNLSESVLERTAKIIAIQKSVTPNKYVNGRIVNENAPATPQNTLGNANPAYPQNDGGDIFHTPAYQTGSGETSYTTLEIATHVASGTVGMDVVNVVPIDAPWTMLTYLETVYGNGTLDGEGEGATNAPIYISVSADEMGSAAFDTAITGTGAGQLGLTQGSTVYFYGSDLALRAKFIGLSEVTGYMDVEVVSRGSYDSGTFVYTPNATTKIKDIFANDVDLAIPTAGSVATGGNTIDDTDNVTLTNARADYVSTMATHIQGFSNFATGSADPMTREEQQTGIGNTLGLRMTSKSVQTKAYEVTFTLTRTQMQDYPREGVDPVSRVARAAQNELIQEINDLILRRVRRLGVTHAAHLSVTKGLDLNFYVGPTSDASTALSNFEDIGEFVDINGNDRKADFPTVKNVSQLTNSGETNSSLTTQLVKRITKASIVIYKESKRGSGNFAVVNAMTGALIKSIVGFRHYRSDTNITTSVNNDRMHMLGQLNNINIYVDPKMGYDDNVVIVGRKGEIDEPGVYFMPYIMSDMVSTIAEGTMSFKGVLTSRFALVDAGFFPEKHYFTFACYTPNADIF